MPPRVVVWFRNDLRLHDNATLSRAAELAKGGKKEVVPVFCFDPRFMADRNVLDRHPGNELLGTAKVAAHRAKFQMESVNALKSALKAIESDLFIYYDRPEAVIPELLSDSKEDFVLTQEESTYEETQVDRAVRAAIKGKGKLQTIWGHTMYHIEDLPFKEDLSDMPDVFTPFKQAVEKKCNIRSTLPTPSKGALPLPSGLKSTEPANWDELPLDKEVKAGGPPKMHPNAVLDFRGGEDVALARLQYYLWDKDLIADYFNTRNGMLGGDYSTKFSPWLSHGCLSPRTVYHEVRKYEHKRTENKSTYWVIFELTWRDYYRFFAVKHGNAIFFEDGITGQSREWNSDPQVLQSWREGKTGMPLVDANMRELSETGFMSNRGRQNVASYLVLDLGVDWRFGADWFEHHLLDHDVTSNWGNWVAAAGLTGGRVNKFNIVKQSKDYDHNGDYIKTWIPELKNVQPAHIHEPWAMSKSAMEEAGCQIGSDYPQPLPTKQRNTSHHKMNQRGRPQRGGHNGRGRSNRGKQQRVNFY